jgi:type II secretory ATPase GspE/PulE/Tfp pilus assembly ATPase PilB-like protein
MLRATASVRRAIEEEASTDEVRRRAVADGMRLMWQDGLEKARLGLTTLEEVARVVAVQSTDDGGGDVETTAPERLAA